MVKRKLKGYVLPSLYLLTVITVFLGVNYLVKFFNNDYSNYVFATKTLNKDSVSVVSTEGEKDIIIKPFLEDRATISKNYYDMNDDAETQQKSLIYYEKTYMENTGILYSAEETFDVIAVLDGTIKDVKTDDILGNVVEIEHSSNLITVYYSLGEISVKKGDRITQGETIATSSSNKLENEKENCLLFEVYHKGNLIDPENFYTMNPNEL